MKEFLKRYKHAGYLVYLIGYLIAFQFLEKNVTTNFHEIHTWIDDKIPFCEYFIIPYLMWFAFVAVTIIYFVFQDKKGYYRLITFLFTGMTLFLLISYMYPNGHHLRPNEFARDNIFVDMVRMLYKIDTDTNVLPSIHVYNSIGCYIAISKSPKLRQKKGIQIGSFVLMVLIILATMFLKQHSVIDVVAGTVMARMIYEIVYHYEDYLDYEKKRPRLVWQK
ncbi:MAG: phosphatase PAP2 family protein [Lachnospiraceae bacterium]|nr:phosphatase PAP2 family protein [Robinsoniella sp.]MDY3765743.1 phosphatase PAP2 family protein [Lachnospiraceae bacterium]